MTSRPTVEPAGVSEGKLMELYEASPNVLLRVTDNELRGLGPLVRDVIDDLLAARQQLAEMRGLVEELRNDFINIIVGGCTCGTKPPDPALHELNCHYRMAETGMARIAKCAALAPTSQPERGKCDCPIGGYWHGAHHVKCSFYQPLIRCYGYKRVTDPEEPRSTTPCPGCADCAQPERQGADKFPADYNGRELYDFAPKKRPSPPQDDIVAGLRKIREGRPMTKAKRYDIYDRAIAALEARK